MLPFNLIKSKYNFNDTKKEYYFFVWQKQIANSTGIYPKVSNEKLIKLRYAQKVNRKKDLKKSHTGKLRYLDFSTDFHTFFNYQKKETFFKCVEKIKLTVYGGVNPEVFPNIDALSWVFRSNSINSRYYVLYFFYYIRLQLKIDTYVIVILRIYFDKVSWNHL